MYLVLSLALSALYLLTIQKMWHFLIWFNFECVLHMPRPHTNGNDLLQQIMIASKCECKEGNKRRQTNWHIEIRIRFVDFITFYYINTIYMSHAFHMELVIAQALSIVIYYGCCRHHRRYLPLSTLILISYYYNVNDSRQRIPIETVVGQTQRFALIEKERENLGISHFSSYIER